MSAKKTAKKITTKKVPAKKPETVVIAESPYVDVSWHQEFVDEEDGAIHSFEFKIPPASISIGDFVEFAFSNFKGRVIEVRHHIRDNMRPFHVEKPHLHHHIRIIINTNNDVAN